MIIENFNFKIKNEYINHLIKNGKSHYNLMSVIFGEFTNFEIEKNKDLCSFDKQELLDVYAHMARKRKYTTLKTYNSLVKEYKDWVFENKRIDGVILDICTTTDLKSIKQFSDYYIINDFEKDELTNETVLDGADYNCAIFIRLLWELDGQVNPEDILKLKISNLNYENYSINLLNHTTNEVTTYIITPDLFDMIDYYANKTYLEFAEKAGKYAIKSAEQNNGYIFRTTFSKFTVVGEPMQLTKMSNLMFQFGKRHINESISITDIQMSLALKYMVTNMQSPTEMSMNKRYFKNIPSKVYQNLFESFAKNKFPEEYEKYMNYYRQLRNKYAIIK